MKQWEQKLKSTPGIDYETAVKRMSDNAALYAELLRLFFKDDPLKNLAAAFEREDYKAAEYEAHSIKGTAANLGLTEISWLAAGIHRNLKDEDLQRAKVMFVELGQAYRLLSNIAKQLEG